jgi:hypothetical protein
MQQLVDPQEFLKKTAIERLKVLLKSGLWAMLVVSFVTVLAVPFIFYHSVGVRIDLRREQAIHQQAIAQAVLEALPRLDFAIAELSKQDTDKATAIRELEEARAALSRLRYTRSGVDSRSSLEPEWKWALMTSAYAQSQPAIPTLPSEAKRWLLGGVLGVLAIVFIICIVAIFMTKDAEVLRFAFDTVKTLMGFFIGVATTLIGST